MVHVTGFGVSELLSTTRWEMMEQVKGRGRIGDYLFQLYEDFVEEYPGRGKPIWDIAPVAWLLNSELAEDACRGCAHPERRLAVHSAGDPPSDADS